MACTSGCYGAKPQAVEANQDQVAQPEPVEPETKPVAKLAGAYPVASPEEEPNRRCCGGEEGDCSAKKIHPDKEKHCSKGKCCDDETCDEKSLSDDSCCSPPEAESCCTDACWDRLAMREFCSSDTASATTGFSRLSCCGQSGTPCQDHRLQVRRRYMPRLQGTLGCLCRLLAEAGQSSCCVEERKAVSGKKSVRCVNVGCGKGVDKKSVDSCCAKKKNADLCSVGVGCEKKSVDCCERKSEDSCCKKSVDCCDKKGKRVAYQQTLSVDPEKSLCSAPSRHVVLSVSGMTCTGCETKLVRSLAPLQPTVTRIQTSLVLSRVEFDLQQDSASSVQGVIQHLERSTGFRCEEQAQKQEDDQASLDFVVEASARLAVQQLVSSSDWPGGVSEMKLLDSVAARRWKRGAKASSPTLHVCFDPRVVGARDLLDTLNKALLPGSLRLSPPSSSATDASLAAGRRHVWHLGLATVLSALLTIPVLVFAWAPLPSRLGSALDIASLVLASIVQIGIAGPVFYGAALRALVFAHVIEMDLLVVLSTSAAYIFSVVSFSLARAGRPIGGDQSDSDSYFETSTLLVTLILVGRFVAALARQKAVESLSRGSSHEEKTATVVVGTEEVEISPRLLQYGDVFRVPPQSLVPTDGTVVSGTSDVDESLLTGESRPVLKSPGSSVLAETRNVGQADSTLTVRLARLPGENTASQLSALTDRARLSRPCIQNFADVVASVFVPVVLALAAVVFAIWMTVGTAVQHRDRSTAASSAISYAIAVLIVSCPCAVGLAVPMVVVMATGVAAKRFGVVFVSAEAAVEVAHRVSHVVLDKTGTLTLGELSVTESKFLDQSFPDAPSLLLGLVAGVHHPVSQSIARFQTQDTGVVASEVSDLQVFPGKGVQATAIVSGKTVLLRGGNHRWISEGIKGSFPPLESSSPTVFYFTIDNLPAAVFRLQDSLRPEAASVVTALRQAGKSIHILSGDEPGAVQAVAQSLGIPESQTRSHCSPAAKQDYIQALQSSSSSPSSSTSLVLFCGDGSNDRPAMAQADVGVQMGHRVEQDNSKDASLPDIVLVRPRLTGLVAVLRLSQAARRRIIFNFAWSAVYNTFAVLFASGAFVHVHLSPVWAGLGELVSVLPVIVVAVLIRFVHVMD